MGCELRAGGCSLNEGHSFLPPLPNHVMKAPLIVALLLLSCGLSLVFCAPTAHLIVDLPGLSPSDATFKQYSGMVEVDNTNGRFLHYWFVESQGNPEKDPLVLWLNGGPGCSSLGGLLSENGPFFPDTDGKTLLMNKNSYNMVANVIYLESPAGVGFSYSQTAADYTTGDDRTKKDSYAFLQWFFTNYPEYQNREFWVTGESYGGHYVPELAQYILQSNEDAATNGFINLAGFQAGNAWTNAAMDNIGSVFDWWSHSVISHTTYDAMMDYCDFTDIGPLKAQTEMLLTTPDNDNVSKCNEAVSNAMAEMGDVSIYDLYTDVCTSASGTHLLSHLSRVEHPVIAARAKHMLSKAKASGDEGNDACIDKHVSEYLQQSSVQSAIHVPNLGYEWALCSPRVNYSYSDLLTSVMPIYEDVMKNYPKVQIHVMSGDVDAVVPTTGTKAWLEALDLTVKEKWRPYLVNKQVGGYVTVYDGLTFTTVRGAGHMVPWTQPARALYFFSHMLTNTPL